MERIVSMQDSLCDIEHENHALGVVVFDDGEIGWSEWFNFAPDFDDETSAPPTGWYILPEVVE